VFCHRARKYLGAYLAVLEGADAVVFTGGVGMHQPAIRARIAGGFEWCGLTLDLDANEAALGREAVIGAAGSTVQTLVVPADEERVIAYETAACLVRAPTGGGQ
jgi:acetate kinase